MPPRPTSRLYRVLMVAGVGGLVATVVGYPLWATRTGEKVDYYTYVSW